MSTTLEYMLKSHPLSVTAVGGTSHVPEVAVSSFFSGGGFSNFVRQLFISSVRS